jgi:hypothetical protein
MLLTIVKTNLMLHQGLRHVEEGGQGLRHVEGGSKGLRDGEGGVKV